jgi:hypothetical protein
MANNIILSGADDPATRSFADNTPAAAAPDESHRYAAEWDAAQQRYRAGINAGYSEDDASALYLDPVKNKYQVLKDVPDQMKPAAAKELDEANVSYVQGVNSGYKPEDAQKIFLKPAQEKWVAAADTIPKMKQATEAATKLFFEKSPAMKKEEQDALDQLESGQPVAQVKFGHPMLLTAPGYGPRWSASFNQVGKTQGSDAREIAKEAAAKEKVSSPDTMLTQASKLFKLEVPPDLQAVKNSRLAQLSSSLTNAPSMTPQFKTADDVKAAFKAGKLKREDAMQLLQDQFGLK